MSEPQPNQTLTFNRFADWCLHKDNLTPEARHTVEVLLEKAGTSDCYEAERVLASYTELCSRAYLEEENAELRRVLIEGIGYDRICKELQAQVLDPWQEYTLLCIDTEVDVEPIHLLKMTCPSTGKIHVLRVPPQINSARVAIRWINWDKDAQKFSVQT
jgi:hypothetical protein